MDDDVSCADINGKGSNQPIRIFAHELRIKIWSKPFGIGLLSRAADLKQAIEALGSPGSWKLIQKQAGKNAELFEATFSYMPRNFIRKKTGQKAYASIISTWNDETHLPKGTKWSSGNIGSPLPSQEDFWKKTQYSQTVKDLIKVKRFITVLPVEWTRGENIRIKYPTAIIGNNDRDKGPLETEPDEVLVTANKNSDVSSRAQT